MSANNPGIVELASQVEIGQLDDVAAVVKFAEEMKPDFVFIGPELPLSVGIVDALAKVGIPSVGPNKFLAQLETSKGFTRDLLDKYKINANPLYQRFSSEEGMMEFTTKVDGQFVVKPDGLTGGKGVRVQGDHFQTSEEGLAYAKECLTKDNTVVLEEKLLGQEFSLMAFSDGQHLAFMPAVQDHKRAFNNDEGPNTGGMGSYSDSDHLLPFLTPDDIEAAKKIEYQTIEALKQEDEAGYKGILYGNFIKTKTGPKIIEYNARLGDPEAMNVLQILKTDLVDICQAVINGTLDKLKVEFENQATVCKYVVPEGYPDSVGSMPRRLGLP